MTKPITDVAFDMHQDPFTAAWLLPGAQAPESRTIPHEPKLFRRLVRQILLEAAWHARHRPRVSARLQACWAGHPPRVVAIGQQAQERLRRRFTPLLARGKLAPVAATAVARDLCGLIWLLMVQAAAA